MPSVLPTSDFYAHHSPFGAFASFTLGRHGRGGGFGLELAGPARQDVYIALSRADDGVVRALPFYEGGASGVGEESYTASDAATADGADAPRWTALGPDAFRRSMGWATDTWTVGDGDLTFRLITPFGPIAELETLGDGELRQHVCPAILAEITIDNTARASEAFAFFGIGGSDPLRPLSDTTNRLRGMACGTAWGFAALPDPDVRETLSWSITEAVARASSDRVPEINRLANRGGLLLRAAPGETRTFTLALGFYRAGIATTGIATTYLYSRLFSDLEAVLGYALEHRAEMKAAALARDAELDKAPLNDDRKFLLAHATHSYHGATMLLHDERGVVPPVPFLTYRRSGRDATSHQPLWVVNEGEYRMLNTFDLTVDQAFFETRFHPWTLRNTLDLFVARYAYTDDVQDATDSARPHFRGGLSFTHDMGVANHFTPPGTSSYERGELTGCFSHMTMEQLCNWCLCAAIYGLPSGDGRWRGDRLWMAARRVTLRACLESLQHRDGPDDLRNGLMSLDSVRCGKTGQEITTYDSLDASLGQARANAYIAVKTWAAYLALSRCFDALGEDARAAEAEEQAALAAQAIASQWDAERNCLPAVFEDDCDGYESRILPAIEGLVFPYALGDFDALSEYGPYGELVSILRSHLQSVLVSGVCIDPMSGGIRISSTSENTWASKIFLSQFVAERVLGVPLDASFDAAHARWQREGGCRDFAFTDQIRSTNGDDLGSRYYPRGVTAILWLLPPSPHDA